MYGAQVVPKDKEMIDMREGEKVGRRRIRGGGKEEGRGKEGEGKGREGRREERTEEER